MILSLCIVAYNEEDYLPQLLQDICHQDYPHNKLEIVLIDSVSTDNTRKIMEEFKICNNNFFSIQVLSNTKKSQAAGWNIAINNFRGDVLSRIDAHARLSPNFVTYVMEDISECGENIVGGLRPSIAKKDTLWAKILLQVENSLFGGSVNISRRSHSRRYVKTMFHASYRRDVFEKVGLFNESLLRTEDNEMHYRMRKCGFKLLYDPRILSFQYMRSSFKAMITQKYKNGYWIGKTLKICPRCISLYHTIPAVFVVGLVVMAILVPFYWQPFVLICILYAVFSISNAMLCIIKGGFCRYSILIPFMYLILHLGYGIGTIRGIFSLK